MTDITTTTPTMMTVNEARDITNKIRQNLAVAVVQIKKAFSGRAWIALGYESWNDYCTTEFGDVLRLGRDDRRELVLDLADAGMSTRAIAAATGTSKSTIAVDLTGVQNRTPDVNPDAATADAFDNVIGLDGKRYPRPTPTAEPIEPSPSTDVSLMNQKIQRYLRSRREVDRSNRIVTHLAFGHEVISESLSVVDFTDLDGDMFSFWLSEIDGHIEELKTLRRHLRTEQSRRSS